MNFSYKIFIIILLSFFIMSLLSIEVLGQSINGTTEIHIETINPIYILIVILIIPILVGYFIGKMGFTLTAATLVLIYTIYVPAFIIPAIIIWVSCIFIILRRN
jgi:hypothetical protein